MEELDEDCKHWYVGPPFELDGEDGWWAQCKSCGAVVAVKLEAE